MPVWNLLSMVQPYEESDYLVFGFGGKAMQWVDRWNGSCFDKFPKRKISHWTILPHQDWIMYADSRPARSARYLTFVHNNLGIKHVVIAFKNDSPKPRFTHSDDKIIAYQALPPDPVL